MQEMIEYRCPECGATRIDRTPHNNYPGVVDEVCDSCKDEAEIRDDVLATYNNVDDGLEDMRS